MKQAKETTEATRHLSKGCHEEWLIEMTVVGALNLVFANVVIDDIDDNDNITRNVTSAEQGTRSYIPKKDTVITALSLFYLITFFI